MGYEIRYTYHPRKEDGPGYDEEVTEEKNSKVGKPFDDTPLEKCAAAIMAQLARRDVWVTDVQIFELVKKEISFKEAADGKGIVVKGKKFSLGKTAELVEEDEDVPQQIPQQIPQQQVPPRQMITAQPNPAIKHPHEMIQLQKQNDVESLYSNPNAVSSIGINPRTVDQRKKLYQVIFDPSVPFIPQLKKMKLKLTEGKRYNVHMSHKSHIAITDDSGQVLVVDEKFFSAAGAGLYGDAELGFSESSAPDRPRLAFENDMHMHHPAEQAMAGNQAYKKVNESSRMDIPGNVPLDDGQLPDNLLQVPDLRPGLKV